MRVLLPVSLLACAALGCSLMTPLDDLSAHPLVGDGGSMTDGSAIDGGDAAVDGGPTVTGTLGFVSHWATNGGAYAIAARPGGGWFVAGTFQNTAAYYVPFGGYPMPKSLGGNDAFVASLDANGNPTALTTFGGAYNEAVDGISADANGDVYVGGHTGGMTLGTTALPAGAFLAKLDGKTLGKVAWATGFASDDAAFCSSCVKVAGNAVIAFGVVGSPDYATATLTWGSGKTLATNGSGDTFLARLDATTGAVTSMSQAGGAKNDRAEGLAVDASGDAYLIGSYTGPIKTGQLFDGSNVPPSVGTSYNVVVARVRAAGTVAWVKSYGDPASSPVTGAGIALDAKGRIAFGATISGGVDFGLGPIAGTNGGGAVVVLEEATRKTLFQQAIGGPDNDDVRRVAFDPWGHLLVLGSYGAGATFGTTAFPPTNGHAVYVAKLGTSYALEWVRAGTPRAADGGTVSYGMLGYDVAVASTGAIAISGGLTNPTDFGSGAVPKLSTAPNASDAVAVGYGP